MQNQKPSSAYKNIFSLDVLLLLVLGLTLMLFSIYRRNSAFPAASLDLKVNKTMAVKLAQAYAKTTGFYIQENITSQSFFGVDNDASTFLEFEYPLSVANELMRKEIPIWRWKVILIHDDGEEIKLYIGVDGALQSFERQLSKDRFMPSISHDAAQKKISDYAAKELELTLSDWKLISDEESKLTGRTDHTFIWENEQKDYKGGHLRLSATVSGDKLASLDYFLHVPDSFEQKFKWLRAQNRALSNYSYIIAFLFALGLPVVFLRAWTKGQLRTRFAITCGIIGAVVSFTSSLNEAATIVYSTTNWSMETFLAKLFLNGVLSAIGIGFACTIFAGSIEAIYRQSYPKQVALELFFTEITRALRSISIAKATLLGIALFGITTGYQVIFFLIGKHYGLWFPLVTDDRSILADFVPAWEAISIGIQASTLEELGFRIFILTIIQRVTKSFWIANIVQALIWSFGHSTYPVEPPYARGIELGIGGIFDGWIFRKYGVLPLIIGHYAFDAYLGIQTLFGSHDAIDWFSALLTLAPVIVLPVASLILISKSGVVADQDISNASIAPALTEQSADSAKQEFWPEYRPLTKQQILIAIMFALMAASSALLPQKLLGNEPALRVNHAEAIAIARDYFSKRHFDVTGMTATAWLNDDADPEQIHYIATHATYDQAVKLEKLVQPRLAWNVRLFKPGEPNVFKLRIGPDGVPAAATISIDETTPGAKLDQTEATELANKYLNSVELPSGGHYTIFDTSKLEHPNRTDYTFIAENPSANIGRGRFQISLKVIGDNISDTTRTWVMPDRQKRHHTTTLEVSFIIVRLVCALIVVPNIGYWIFWSCRKQAPNKYLISSAIIVAGFLSILTQVNHISRAALWSYNPTEPIDTHLMQEAFDCLSTTALDIAVAAVLAVIVSSSYQGLFVSNRLRELLKSAKPQTSNYRLWSDGILIGLTAALVWAGLMSLNAFTVNSFSKSLPVASLHYLSWLEQSNVAATTLLDATKYGLLFAFVCAVIMRWSDFYSNQRANPTPEKQLKGFKLLVPILIAMIICVVNLNSSDPQKMICNIGSTLSLAGALYLVLEILGNGNLVGCFFTVFFLTIGRDLYTVQKYMAIIHPIDLMMLYGILIASFLWFLLSLWLNSRTR